MNSNGVVYRCNKSCPIGKRCFILKTAAMLEERHHLNALRK